MNRINTTHNLHIAYSQTFPTNDIFFAYRLAQQSSSLPVILITPQYSAPTVSNSFADALKPPVQAVYDASYAQLVGTDPLSAIYSYNTWSYHL
jgi:hypothetical protein